MYLICAIIKNEHRYLREWIVHHLGIGFDAIYLFEDFGSDSHEEICKEFEQVHLTTCDEYFPIKRDYDTGGDRQWRLYNKFLYDHRDEGWCAFIDIDEFVILKNNWSLSSLCDMYKDYNGIAMYWKMFNASGQIVQKYDSVVKSYTKVCGFFGGESCWCFKSLCNLSKHAPMCTPHEICSLKDTSGNDVRSGCIQNPDYTKIQLNHYYTKSLDDWLYRFKKRGDLVKNHRKVEEFWLLNQDMLQYRDIFDMCIKLGKDPIQQILHNNNSFPTI